jgi:hypothetical protein
VLLKTPTYAHHPPLRVTRSWVPEKVLPNMRFGYHIAAGSATISEGRLWLYGQDFGSSATRTVRGAVFEITLPSLEAQVWPLPDVPSTDVIGASILVERERIFVAVTNSCLAIVDRRTRQWELNRDLQTTALVRFGSALYFLTDSQGARGFVRYSPETREVELLASNRRTPPQSPLDDPGIEAQGLAVGDSGRVEISASTAPIRSGAAPSESTAGARYGTFSYDPATKTWDEAEPLQPATGGIRPFTPLKKAGFATAYRKGLRGNVWTLQLPRDEMPKARIPMEFVAPRKVSPDRYEASDPTGPGARWFWAPDGYVILSHSGLGPAVWFLPQAELDAYLNSHEPREDETGLVPPQPTNAKPSQPGQRR